MATVDLENPLPCDFCGSPDSSPILMPWRRSEGWWTCGGCLKLATDRMYSALNARRIMGVSALPEWMLKVATFKVRRTNGRLSAMSIIDFPCDFSRNKENGDNTDGRVRLSNGDIFLDMCSEDGDDFKAVKLSNLYANNPAMYTHPILSFAFPPYVAPATRAEWDEAVVDAMTYGKKKLGLDDPPASEMTDTEDIETTVEEPDRPPIEEPDRPPIEEPVDQLVEVIKPTSNPATFEKPAAENTVKEVIPAPSRRIQFWVE